MKILLNSHAFSPLLGGIETCSQALAAEFKKNGHEVVIVTKTASTNRADDLGLKVLRQPRVGSLIRAVRWCDVFFQNNISLQTAWPLLFTRKPWVVCTATWLRNPAGSVGLSNHLKRYTLRLATNVYISKAIATHVGLPGVVIPNPYDREIFKIFPGIQRNRSLAFLGRLVSDKGCDLLLESVAALRDAGQIIPLTIIGTGPEQAALERQVHDLRIDQQVYFAGALRGEALARELNRHEIMVVPSRWEEPFGIVALEGIACGCVVIGSNGGGLPDAIGSCGLLFENGNVADLTVKLAAVLQGVDLQTACRLAASQHLQRHQASYVAQEYLEIFSKVVQ